MRIRGREPEGDKHRYGKTKKKNGDRKDDEERK